MFKKTLKKCPFCGANARIHEVGKDILGPNGNMIYVKCNDCSATTCGISIDQNRAYDEAVDTWNRRV